MVLRERSSIGAGETERGGFRVFDFWGFQVMASPSRFHSHLLLTQSKGRVWSECARKLCKPYVHVLRVCDLLVSTTGRRESAFT